MNEKVSFRGLLGVLNQCPHAVARVRGSSAYSTIFGCVYFYQVNGGVLVVAQVRGLPKEKMETQRGIFGFHIHRGSQCGGTEVDPFEASLTHYNPEGDSHPSHAGDLPPLFGNHGYSFQMFFTDRFSVREIIHRTLVIHSGPDDFISQPAGNAGEKIACGEIEVFNGC